MSVKKIVAVNTASQLLGKAIGAGTSFVVAFLLARRLGAEGFGDFTKITTFVAPFFLLADFGLNAIFLQKKDDAPWWPRLLGLRLVGSALLIFFTLAILAFLPHGVDQGYTALVRFGIVLFSPAILFQALITTANALFQKHLRYVHAMVAIAAGSAVTLLLVAPLSIGVLSATIAVLIGTAATAIVSFVFAGRYAPLSVSVARQSIAGLLVPSVPLGATLLFNLVYFRADNYIITLTRPTAEVGIYGLAYKVFEVALVLPTFFMNAMYPLMLSAKSNNSTMQQFNNQLFLRILKKSLFFLLLTSFILLLILWLAAPFLAFIKSDFAASAPALQVLSLGLPFFFLTSLTMWTLVTLKKQWTLAVIYGLSMVFNLLLNIWLIPAYGYMAAAWITVVSEGAVLVLSSILLWKYVQFSHPTKISNS